MCDKGIPYTKSCEYLFQLFDHSAGSRVVQASYLDIVVSESQQYSVVKLTEICSDLCPGIRDEFVLQYQFFSLAFAMRCHTLRCTL